MSNHHRIHIDCSRIGHTRRIMRGLDSDSSAMQAAKDLGGKLFSTVFSGPVSDCFKSSMDDMREKGKGLRIRLRLRDVPELQELPWEFLFDAPNGDFIALSNKQPLVHFLDAPGMVAPLAVEPPLRILVTISSPNDMPQLDVERELKNLQSAHGGLIQSSQQGVLVFENENKLSQFVSGEDLAISLRDYDSLRLVILNARKVYHLDQNLNQSCNSSATCTPFCASIFCTPRSNRGSCTPSKHPLPAMRSAPNSAFSGPSSSMPSSAPGARWTFRSGHTL